jgi:hypothetical protein
MLPNEPKLLVRTFHCAGSSIWRQEPSGVEWARALYTQEMQQSKNDVQIN